MTADFFKTDFGLSGREGAALLIGAHSFGTFNAQISQFRYDWTRKQSTILNNQLFRCLILTHNQLELNLKACGHEASVLCTVCR